MNKIRLFLLMLPAALLLASCKEDHSVRFRNSFSQGLTNVSVGPAYFATVKAGQTTEYKAIETGNFEIKGKTDNGQVLSGSGSISGKGKHKWTVILSAAGTVSMSEDK
ncbi:MAG TPA: hypothetical protein VEB42_05910 [Chitinophagaceae bacterium]|nr:hypothetical protein [Chitinophagaceae bacterium]